MKNQSKLGFWSIVLLTINSIIGIGIFLSPAGVIKMVGSLAPFIYLLAAIFTIFLAVTFASAAKYVSKGGASYAYAKAAFGENVGFYVGITRVVAACIAWGVLATAVVKSIFSILIEYKILDFEINNKTMTIGFLLLMGILLLINMFGTSFLAIISNLSTIGKLMALAITIFVGIYIYLKTGINNMHEIDILKDELGNNIVKNLSNRDFVTAIIAAFYAFTGFESIASGAQDMEKPEKTLPVAIPFAIFLIALFYFGIILISLVIDPVSLVKTTEPVALASIFGNGIIKKIIIVGALLSVFGINVASSFHTPRVFEAMAIENHIPSIFKYRLKNGVPIFSFILTAFISVIIPMVFNYKMDNIIIISSISRFIQFIIVPLCVILFYLDMSSEKVLNAKKSFIIDVIFPIVALILTAVLLCFFDWPGNFSIKSDEIIRLNWSAITAMLVGYIALPLLLWVYKKKFIK